MVGRILKALMISGSWCTHLFSQVFKHTLDVAVEGFALVIKVPNQLTFRQEIISVDFDPLNLDLEVKRKGSPE